MVAALYGIPRFAVPRELDCGGVRHAWPLPSVARVKHASPEPRERVSFDLRVPPAALQKEGIRKRRGTLPLGRGKDNGVGVGNLKADSGGRTPSSASHVSLRSPWIPGFVLVTY